MDQIYIVIQDIILAQALKGFWGKSITVLAKISKSIDANLSKFCKIQISHDPNFAWSKVCTIKILHNPNCAQSIFCSIWILQDQIFTQSKFCTIQILDSPNFAQSKFCLIQILNDPIYPTLRFRKVHCDRMCLLGHDQNFFSYSSGERLRLSISGNWEERPRTAFDPNSNTIPTDDPWEDSKRTLALIGGSGQF